MGYWESHTVNKAKRSWQSYKKENGDLRGLVQHLLSNCPKCDGSGKAVSKEGEVIDCRFCGQARFRYKDATGEAHES